MGRIMILLLILSTSPLFGAEGEKIITPELKSLMKEKGSDELFRVQIVMAHRLDPVEMEKLVRGMAKEERRSTVLSELKRFTENDQKEVFAFLKEKEAEGKVKDLRSLWINNTISGKMTKGVIAEVSKFPGIQTIDDDPIIKMIETRKSEEKPPRILSIEWNVTRVTAPCAWSLGYKGQGIIVGNIDTGVNYNHTDLVDHIWINLDEIPGNLMDDDSNGYIDDRYGYDFANNDGNPMDDHGHGTHTAGTVAGDGTGGDSVGVAPDARIMSIKVLDSGGSGSWPDVWAGVQYGLDNGADVLTISIGSYSPDDCQSSARTVFDNALLAGVVSSIAAGNIGPPPRTINNPGTVPPPWLHPDQTESGGLSGVITVGATSSGGSDPIWSFSSRGPTTCWFDYNNSPYLIDPDIVAPGAGIISLNYTGGYSVPWDGTSMATPHIAGCIAVMLSKNPTLTPAKLDSIIEMTAVPRGSAGKDTIYGSGRLDCCAAVNAVVGVEESPKPEAISMKFSLFQNLPNPLHHTTSITFALPKDGRVSLRIYDITGRLVRTLVDEKKISGIYEVYWDGKDGENQKVTSGIYFYQLKSNNGRLTKRLILLR